MKLEHYELPARALAAALTHAPKKDTQTRLNGVYLDLPNGVITATDGHRMFVGKIPQADFSPVFIPYAEALRIVRAAKQEIRNGWSLAVCVSEASMVSVAVTQAGVTVTFGAIISAPTNYPDYARVVPREPSGEAAQFNLDYLADARKALALYSGKARERCFPHVAHNGRLACLVTAGTVPAFCVVMPVRGELIGDEMTWFHAPAKPAKAA